MKTLQQTIKTEQNANKIPNADVQIAMYNVRHYIAKGSYQD